MRLLVFLHLEHYVKIARKEDFMCMHPHLSYGVKSRLLFVNYFIQFCKSRYNNKLNIILSS